MSTYTCYICGTETDDPHTDPETGEDICADCCPRCNPAGVSEEAKLRRKLAKANDTIHLDAQQLAAIRADFADALARAMEENEIMREALENITAGIDPETDRGALLIIDKVVAAALARVQSLREGRGECNQTEKGDN